MMQLDLAGAAALGVSVPIEFLCPFGDGAVRRSDYLGTLRRNELAVVNGDEVTASPTLFIDGA